MQFKQNRQCPVKLSSRLYARLRRRLYTIGSVPSRMAHQEQAWTTLYHAQPSHEGQFCCMSIRSGQLHSHKVYALYKLAGPMKEAGRSRCKNLISKALQVRNCTVPKRNKALNIPFLSHEPFRRNIEQWLRRLIINHKDHAIPFFLPTHKLRETAFPKLRELLRNHRKFEQAHDVASPKDLPCCCSLLE